MVRQGRRSREWRIAEQILLRTLDAADGFCYEVFQLTFAFFIGAFLPHHGLSQTVALTGKNYDV